MTVSQGVSTVAASLDPACDRMTPHSVNIKLISDEAVNMFPTGTVASWGVP